MFPTKDNHQTPGMSERDGAFAQLEKQQQQKQNAHTYQERVAELEQVSAERWTDPYGINAQLRKTFRAEKHARLRRELSDASLRERIGWSQDRLLAGPSSSEPGYSTPDMRQAWVQAQDAKERTRLEHPSRRVRDRKLPSKAVQSLTPAAQSLAGRLLSNTHTKKKKNITNNKRG